MIGGEFRTAQKLARASRQDNLVSGIRAGTVLGQALAHKTEDLGNAGADDVREPRLRCLVHRAVLFTREWIRERFVFVRLGRHQCAIKRFDSLGFHEWRLQRFGDVECDVLRADRNDLCADETAVGEQRQSTSFRRQNQ